MSIKQVILARTDLNMRKGKLAAQAAHASLKVFFDLRDVEAPRGTLIVSTTPEMDEWIKGMFTKIVLGVESEAELVQAYDLARAARLPTALVIDAGATEFHGVPTKTTVAIGPAEAEEIDKITGSNETALIVDLSCNVR